MKKSIIHVVAFLFIMLMGINTTTAQKNVAQQNQETVQVNIDAQVETALASWTDRLKLSAEQQTSLRAPLKEYFSVANKIKMDKTLSKAEKKEKVSPHRKQFIATVKGQLTEEQIKVLEKTRKSNRNKKGTSRK